MKKLCLNAHFSSFIRWRLLVIVSILLSGLLDFLDVRYAAAALCLLCVQRIIPHEFMGMFAAGKQGGKSKASLQEVIPGGDIHKSNSLDNEGKSPLLPFFLGLITEEEKEEGQEGENNGEGGGAINRST